jgi:hypothetical protein
MSKGQQGPVAAESETNNFWHWMKALPSRSTPCAPLAR